MAGRNRQPRLGQREPLTDTMMLMLISIGIFAAMYIAAMLTLKGGFLKPQMFFDLLNDNAYLIIISCGLTIVMIGGGINISVGGVISLTVMSCALFLNSFGCRKIESNQPGIDDSAENRPSELADGKNPHFLFGETPGFHSFIPLSLICMDYPVH